jgi:oligopeptide/dipeptide ABC transporter ATP-binding protein
MVEAVSGAAAVASPGAGERSSRATLLEVNNLNVHFSPENPVRAVSGLSFSMSAGETVALVGESGSGKTASARAIMGLLPSTAVVTGSVKFEGIEILGLARRELRRHRGRDIAMVFQDAARSLNPTMRVGAQISEAIRAHQPVSRSKARRLTVELLRMVRLPSAEQRLAQYPHELSGGMRQRVMIAMALACRPKVLIADEATTALDVTTQAQIMTLLKDLQGQFDMALLMITHDMALASSYSDRIFVMYAGRVVEYAPTRRFFTAARMPYTRALIDAVPDMSLPAHSLLPRVPGRPPDLRALPRGCAFSPRCGYSDDRCQAEAPALEEGSPGHGWMCFHPLPERSTANG